MTEVDYSAFAQSSAAGRLYAELRTVHTAMKRALKRVIDVATTFDEGSDPASFIQYCKLFRQCLVGHLSYEDKFIVPLLATSCNVSKDVADSLEYDHKLLALKVDSFERATMRPYSGEIVADAATCLLESLTAVMDYEDSLMLPAVLDRAGAQLLEQAAKKATSPASLCNSAIFVPFLVSNLKKTEADAIFNNSRPTLRVLIKLFRQKNKKVLRYSWAFAPMCGDAYASTSSLLEMDDSAEMDQSTDMSPDDAHTSPRDFPDSPATPPGTE